MGSRTSMAVRAAAVVVVVCMSLSAMCEKPALEEFAEVVEPLSHAQPDTELVQEDKTAATDMKKVPESTKLKGKIDQMEPWSKAMFVPRDWKLPKVPEAAGNEERFARETASQKRSSMESLGVSRSSNEKMRGLTIVSSVMKKRAQAAEIKHQDHLVAEKMNHAAQLAAIFKSKVGDYDKAKVVVQKAKLEVKAQKAVVDGFAKQEKAAKALLKQKMKQLRDEQRAQLHKRYLMEVAAHAYKIAKVLAIKLDRKAQERRAKTKQMKYYASVAEKAVENAERKAQSKTLKKTKKKTKKKKTKKKKTKKKKAVCKDCVTLPKEYRKQLASYSSGNKKRVGTCKDCAMWAKDGYCENKQFKPFMRKFYRGSCHAKNPKGAHCGTQ